MNQTSRSYFERTASGFLNKAEAEEWVQEVLAQVPLFMKEPYVAVETVKEIPSIPTWFAGVKVTK